MTSNTVNDTTRNASAHLDDWERELLGYELIPHDDTFTCCCPPDESWVKIPLADVLEMRKTPAVDRPMIIPVLHREMMVATREPRKKAPQVFTASPGEPRLAVNGKKRRKHHELRLFCETVRVADLAKATNRTTKEMVEELRASGEWVKDGRATIPTVVARQFA